jgi:hypothetical protein
MIEASIFIGLLIIAVTQFVKLVWPEVVTGAVTILVALIVGSLVGGFGQYIGVDNVSVASGVVTALLAVGIHTTVSSASSNS